jgi:CBS domain-containing protein
MREIHCPVLTGKNVRSDEFAVAEWMTPRPVTVSPDGALKSSQLRMGDGGFRSIPVVDDGKLVGIVTDRDLRANLIYTDCLKIG